MTSGTFDPTTVDAVVFDIGGVFLFPHPEPVREHFRTEQVPTPDDDDAYVRAHHAGVRELSRHLEVSGAPDNYAPEYWEHYGRAYGRALGIDDAAVLERFAVAAVRSWTWAHEANIAAFHSLAGLDRFPLAIVSNNDGTAAEQLVDFGVCQTGPGPLPSVAVVTDSTRVGVAKPDPAIFLDAVDAVDTSRDRILYVGDTVHADVVGATRAGLQVVQLDPYDHHADRAHSRAADVAEVVDRLVTAQPA
ncbi:MAG: HAD family hydrolase [Acidimicrobiales bacterium]